jgi:GlcNAc-PI de-N-acetylase
MTNACFLLRQLLDWKNKTAEFSYYACLEVNQINYYSLVYYSTWKFFSKNYSGDYEKQGDARKDELWNACKCFDIKPQDITLTHCTLLPDDPNAEWRVELLSSLILDHIEALDIDLVITFDKDGVSHHKNHQALYYATASLCLSGLMPSSCKIFILETVNIIRKYLSCFDVLLSLLSSTNWYASFFWLK